MLVMEKPIHKAAIVVAVLGLGAAAPMKIGKQSSSGSFVLRTVQVAGADTIVADQAANTVVAVGNGVATLLNAHSGGILATAQVGAAPYSVAVDDTSRHVFVVSAGNATTTPQQPTVMMLDSSTGAVQKTIALAGPAVAGSSGTIVLDERTGRAFIASGGGYGNGANFTILDTHSGAVLASKPTSIGSILGLDERAGHVFATNIGNTMVMLDATTGATIKALPTGPAGPLVIDEARSHGFFVNGQIMMLNTVTGSIVKQATGVSSNQLDGVDQQTGRVYSLAAPSSDYGTVTVFDTASDQLVRSTNIAAHPQHLVVDESLHRAFVTGYSVAPTDPTHTPGTLTVLDSRTGAPLATVQVGAGPSGVAVDDATGLAFVANTGDNSVSVVSTKAGLAGLITTTRVGADPSAVAVDTNIGHAFVVNSAGNSVTVIGMSNGAVLRTTHVGLHPIAVAIDARTRRAFVADYKAQSVSVLDTGSGAIVRTASVGKNPVAIGVDTRAARAFVVNANGYSVSVMDTRSGAVLHTIPVGAAPVGIAVDSVRHRAFVVNRDSNTVSVIDTKALKVVATVTVPTTPVAIAADTTTGHVFVSAQVGHSVSVLNENNGALIATVSASGGPVVVDQRTKRVFIAGLETNNPDSGVLTVLDAANGTVIPRPALAGPSSPLLTGLDGLGRGPYGLATDSAEGYLLVVNATDDTLSVLDAKYATPLGTIGVGDYPIAVAVDETAHRAVVVNNGSKTVSILNTTRFH